MSRLRAEPLVFCLAWAVLALAAGLMAGWKAGAALSVGLMLFIMPVSSVILSRTENFATERLVRWGILTFVALGFGLWIGGAVSL